MFREDAKHPVTGEPVKCLRKNPFVGVPDQETVYQREHFEFTIHEGKLKIMTMFMGPRIHINDVDSVMWNRWRDLSNR